MLAVRIVGVDPGYDATVAGEETCDDDVCSVVNQVSTSVSTPILKFFVKDGSV